MALRNRNNFKEYGGVYIYVDTGQESDIQRSYLVYAYVISAFFVRENFEYYGDGYGGTGKSGKAYHYYA